MRRNAGKRIDLYHLIKMYKQLDGDAGKVNVEYIKSLDLEDLDEEIRRVRDFIADIQHFEPLIKKYEEEQKRLDAISFTERKLNDDALQLQDIEDRLMGRRTRMASDVIRELEVRIARLEKQSAKGLDKKLQEEIISMIEQEFEDDLSGMTIEFKAMSKAKAKSGKEYTLYELVDLGYYAITDGKKGYWMISEDKREAEKEMSDLKRNKHAGRRRQTPQALVELGRRGRDHLNSQIFEYLGSYGDDNKQYVAVDVEDQVEFFDDPSSPDVEGTYVKLNVELEYIDRATNREKSERSVFYLVVPPRSIKRDIDGVYDENSIFKAILHTDSSDLEEQ